MKNLKKLLALVMIAAVVVSFSFALVACNKNKESSEELTSDAAIDCLFNTTDGAVVKLSGLKNMKVEYTEVKGAKTTVGTAIVTDDVPKESSVNASSIAYSKKTVTEGTTVTETEYYAGSVYRIRKNGTDAKTKPYYFYRTKVGGEITAQGTEELFVDSVIKSEYNTYVNDCGVYDANAYIDKTIFYQYGDIIDTVVCSGKKLFYDGNLTGIEIKITYNYLENNATVNGTIDVKLDASNRITAIKIVESNGYSYDARYTHDVPTIYAPSYDDIGNPNWVARTEPVQES